MLPPGHIAAGYLVTKAVVRVMLPHASPAELRALLSSGMFLAFAPDLDTFISFARIRALKTVGGENYHRRLLTHAPLLWLILGLAFFFFGGSPFLQALGILLWLCPWSHFVLDSIKFGVMWLWPFSDKLYALSNAPREYDAPGKGFFGYWFGYLRFYMTKNAPTFIVEIALLVAAFVVFF